MNNNRRQEARRVFMAVADLPAVEQAEALARSCAGDEALRAEVNALLRAETQAGGFMADPTNDAAGDEDAATATPRESAGQQIGRYKLLEQIGEGGFGTVWAAEQREPVKRRVALKIIKLGMDTRQVIARFEAERQALAMMDHPNIARVLDAGSTETGRPFFVMELVKGVPILEYCDHERLDTRTRLDLFTKVCRAIQHAHQKGIIHRDIKPSNVLITLHDGVPVPKVIDFGIAKATNQELTSKTIYTEHRQMIGTPAYMSPEQAEMSGLDIDTRSDIYSLGVLLYELLTGTTPFDSKSLLEAGFAEMMRIIREQEPLKPSTRLSSLGETGTRTAEQRRVDVHKLSMLLRGDLDWIVMKCLEKDRTRRYDTANGLAADIVRHLSDEPVLAGPPSTTYRLRKFVKRNRGQVVAAGMVAGALVSGIIGTSIGMAWALDERSRANRAVDAEIEARQAAQASATEAASQRDAARRVVDDMMKTLTDELKRDAEADGGWLQGHMAITAEPGSETAALGIASGVLIDAFVDSKESLREEVRRTQEALDWSYKTTMVLGNMLSTPDAIAAHEAEWADRLARLMGRAGTGDTRVLRERGLYLVWRSQRLHARAGNETNDALRADLDALGETIAALETQVPREDPLWAAMLNTWTRGLHLTNAPIDELARAYDMLIDAFAASRGESDSITAQMMIERATILFRAERKEEALAALERYVTYRDAHEITPDAVLDARHEMFIQLHGDARQMPGGAVVGRFMRIYYDDACAIFDDGSLPHLQGAATYMLWLMEHGDPSDAAALVNDSLTAFERNEALNELFGDIWRCVCGDVLVHAGQDAKAQALLTPVLPRIIRRRGEDDWFTHYARTWLGAAMIGQGRHAEGQALIDQSADALVTQPMPESPFLFAPTGESEGSGGGFGANTNTGLALRLAAFYERIGDVERTAKWRAFADR